MIKKILFLALILLSFIYPNFVLAVDFDIKKFDVEMTVGRDKTIHIVENIDVNFFNSVKGLQKNIYRADFSSGKLRGFPNRVENLKVSEQYSANITEQDYQLKIGDPNKRVFGDKHYRIEYDYVMETAFHDQLTTFGYWLFDWGSSIKVENFSYRIIMPSSVSYKNVDVYLYDKNGNHNQGDIPSITGEQIYNHHSTMRLGEGIFIRIKFPEPYFERRSRAIDNTSEPQWYIENKKEETNRLKSEEQASTKQAPTPISTKEQSVPVSAERQSATTSTTSSTNSNVKNDKGKSDEEVMLNLVCLTFLAFIIWALFAEKRTVKPNPKDISRRSVMLNPKYSLEEVALHYNKGAHTAVMSILLMLLENSYIKIDFERMELKKVKDYPSNNTSASRLMSMFFAENDSLNLHTTYYTDLRLNEIRMLLSALKREWRQKYNVTAYRNTAIWIINLFTLFAFSYNMAFTLNTETDILPLSFIFMFGILIAYGACLLLYKSLSWSSLIFIVPAILWGGNFAITTENYSLILGSFVCLIALYVWRNGCSQSDYDFELSANIEGLRNFISESTLDEIAELQRCDNNYIRDMIPVAYILGQGAAFIQKVTALRLCPAALNTDNFFINFYVLENQLRKSVSL